MTYELAVDDCGTVDAGGPDDDQYGNPPDDQPGVKPGDVDDPDDVILAPILEDKKLVNTDGIPLVAVAGLLLACVTGLFVRVLRG
jgi:hypothetical protein